MFVPAITFWRLVHYLLDVSVLIFGESFSQRQDSIYHIPVKSLSVLLTLPLLNRFLNFNEILSMFTPFSLIFILF